MSLNVGSMMRALLGDGLPTEGRSLELKIGQIVRGVLLGMLENNEALFQIGGVHVRAKVETELPVGKGTLLQVQPDSKAGLIVLKPLADTSDPAAGEAMTDLAKSFGLPDQKWGLELLRGLKRDGYPIDKATAGWFRQAAEGKPDDASAQEWMNAAGVAFRRGLAPTETTIASLRQALYGPPLSDQLRQLETKLTDYLRQAQPDSAATNLARRTADMLAQGKALLVQAGEQLLAAPPEEGGALGQARVPAAKPEAAEPGLQGRPDGAAARTNGGEAGQAAPAANEGAATRSGGASNAPAPPMRAPGEAGARAAAAAAPEMEPAALPGGGRANPAAAQGSAAATMAGAGGNAPAPEAMAAPNADGAFGQERAAAGAGRHSAPASAGAGSEPQPAASGREDAAGPRVGGGDGSAARAAAAAGGALRADASWLGRMLQWLGVEHERQALQLAGDGADGTARSGTESGESDASRTVDTLKGALLAMASSDDLPASLRDAAQGMAHQITGQQLLLTTERQNTAMMSHMTLFVPLKGADGDTTATIHVQTRRGSKGEWDSGNCRLMFDLRMSHLGDTLVDVQVVDHAVSLKLLNDRPWVAELVESARGEATAGLRAAGYQLLSLKATPFPVPVMPQDAAQQEASRSWPERLATGAYAAKPYKGVDYLA